MAIEKLCAQQLPHGDNRAHKSISNADAAFRFKLYMLAERLSIANDMVIPHTRLTRPDLPLNASCRQMQLNNPSVKVLSLEMKVATKLVFPPKSDGGPVWMKCDRSEWSFEIKNGGGNTYGDVYDKAQRIIARAHADNPLVRLKIGGLHFIDGFARVKCQTRKVRNKGGRVTWWNLV
ncbi:hypothetical protein Slin15195_G081910 [Septoria linicola]|uniref:Uncharacterized protein n=1 Tax=Septoria linicola TaxID=215465 RepID=A0A9Q9ELW5_9PEZI|nr:hypothetical protein Slin15195_G081910 [Septoria linicola]